MAKQKELGLNDARIYSGALAEHVGGEHYKGGGIEPLYFAEVNGIPFCAGNVLKYLVRHNKKGGREDIERALDYCRKAIALYDESPAWRLGRSEVWSVQPSQFITSNKLDETEAEVVRRICEGFKGMAHLFLAERALVVLVKQYAHHARA